MNLSWTGERHLSGESLENKKYKLQSVYSWEIKITTTKYDGIWIEKAISTLKRRCLKDLDVVNPMMLLGLQHSYLGLPTIVETGGMNKPIACKTKLG